MNKEMYQTLQNKIENIDIIINKNNRYCLNPEVSELYMEILDGNRQYSNLESILRTCILHEMMVSNFDRLSDDNIKISLVMPKPSIEFDVDKFILNENQDIVSFATSFSTKETFDIDKFMNENPDLYNKYLTTTVEPNVDITKLKDNLPNVFSKYGKEIPSNKPVSLRITKVK